VPRQKLYEKLKSMLGQLGKYPGDPAQHLYEDRYSDCRLAHQAGTCQFGAEATSSLRVGDHLIGRLI